MTLVSALLSRRALLAAPLLVPALSSGRAKADVRSFGARGDGRTDDTLAIQAALDTGNDVHLPAAPHSYVVSAQLNLRTIGQAVTGDGDASLVVQRGRDAQANVFRALDLGSNRFEGLRAIPGTVTHSLSYGYGFVLYRSPRSVVAGCSVSGHRRGGIAVFDSDDCVVSNNAISDSVTRPGPGMTQSDTGNDIYLAGSCSRCVVQGNRVSSGSGVGIGIQTLGAGNVANSNRILDNRIDGEPLYGIMVYLMSVRDECADTLIAGNLVSNVSGLIPETSGRYNYGTGIYLQGADRTTVLNNVITEVVTRSRNGLLPDLDNVPAAIGASGRMTQLRITRNRIARSSFWGVAVVQAGNNRLETLVEDNEVREVLGTPIYLLDVDRTVVRMNRVITATARASPGILLRTERTPGAATATVNRNVVEGQAVGIEFQGPPPQQSEVSGNVVIGASGYALGINGEMLTCVGNQSRTPRPNARGIQVGRGTVRGRIHGNVLATCHPAIETVVPASGLQLSDNRAVGVECK